jgi:hypothetical protein
VKLPIITDNRSDLCIFGSIKNAEAYIEPIDILNSEWVIYDSEGRLLTASIVKKGRLVESIVLEELEDEPRHQGDLRNALIDFLVRAGGPKEFLSACSLEQLVEKGQASRTL